MKMNRRQLKKLIMESVTGVEKGVRDYLSNPDREDERYFNPSTQSYGTGADHDLTDDEIFSHNFDMDRDMYGEEDMDRSQFDSEIQEALDKLEVEGIIERTVDGYIMLDPNPLNGKGRS